VSVGGWTKIRLRRITRSSTCICLRIRNYWVFSLRSARYGCSAHATLELRTRGSCCTLFHPCTLALRARSRTRRPHSLCPLPQWVFVPIWGLIGPARWAPMRYVCWYAHVCARINAHSRPPTPITYAHCSNECLYQFGPRSAQLFGRLCWMCNNTRMFARAHQCAQGGLCLPVP
jgi:hypothetical protein